ncbi:tyrosine-type recombinase/integrase [Mycolicibacterium rufum]|uniref:Tyrosine-type recombinase/integrase n=1 Tax=Mycolicibacterium rufum TaxID=318424 RepID=A0ABY3UBB8_9MYCO|nr:tyrosine-type recombinase/integrase [Mycolicibacterium rufum]KGI70251.1 integrase [Mycolicibacterium rufum]ULP36547.1 tyrosine-type recombinase/integrase [Mycolicibacterium rufum]
MPRQRMLPGEHGRITERSHGGKYYATTYFRDSDGKRRRVERSSDKSAEDARRMLQRHLKDRRPPITEQEVTDRSTLSELFELWIVAKADQDGVSEQTVDQYRQVWARHGANQLGALRIREVDTTRAHRHVQAMGATTQAKRLRMILLGMMATAVRFGVITVNPIRETKPAKAVPKKVVRKIPAEDLSRVRASVREYADREGPGPRPGRLLPAFVDLLVATGARPNEVLALRWSDCDLNADPPTVTIRGTLIDHGRIEGKPLHRQDRRKGDAPEHTVLLPRIGVEALEQLKTYASGDGPVFANREGGWMSLANMRRSLRAALPEDLRAVITPHTFRRAVATVVRDKLGSEKAQQQLSHAKLATTEKHYLQRHTAGPDVRAVLDEYTGVRE